MDVIVCSATEEDKVAAARADGDCSYVILVIAPVHTLLDTVASTAVTEHVAHEVLRQTDMAILKVFVRRMTTS